MAEITPPRLDALSGSGPDARGDSGERLRAKSAAAAPKPLPVPSTDLGEPDGDEKRQLDEMA